MNFFSSLTRILLRVLTGFGLFRFISEKTLGKRITAVAALTLKAAFRFRLVIALAFILALTVIGLPLIIKGDGTARGLTQILLTYTIGINATLLGFATLWLGCGSLARDIEECQIQVVASKPIPRWQIWIGKWMGILALNAMLLTASGIGVYTLIMWRAKTADLRPDQRAVLNNEILIGRISAKEHIPDLAPAIKKITEERLKDPDVAQMDREYVEKQVGEMVKARLQAVKPKFTRRWQIKLSSFPEQLRDRPMSIRYKFHSAQLTNQKNYQAFFVVGVPDTAKRQAAKTVAVVDSFQELPIPPNMFDEKGVLTIDFINENDMTLLFPLEDGMEVLYRECGFGLNFMRGHVIIFLWLALLAAIGLACASFLSFPVAAFTSLSILIVGLSSGLLGTVAKEGSVLGKPHDEGTPYSSIVDQTLVPFFVSIFKIVKLVEDFSPVDNLSSGRSVTWGELGRALLQITILMTGFFVVCGLALFQRRELATAQGTQ